MSDKRAPFQGEVPEGFALPCGQGTSRLWVASGSPFTTARVRIPRVYSHLKPDNLSGLIFAWHRYRPWEYTKYSLRLIPCQAKTILTNLCQFSIKGEYKYQPHREDHVADYADDAVELFRFGIVFLFDIATTSQEV